MDESTFAASTVALLETGDDVRLRQFIRSFPAKVGPSVGVEEFTAALDKWTIFSAQALHFERPDLVEEAIGQLHEFYKSLGVEDLAIRKRFVVVTRLYVIGALAVRLEAWETVRALALRPVPSSVNDQAYIYSSWIRNATVFVARSGHLTFDADNPEQHRRSGFILSPDLGHLRGIPESE